MHKAAPQWVVWSQLVQTDKRIYMSGMPHLTLLSLLASRARMSCQLQALVWCMPACQQWVAWSQLVQTDKRIYMSGKCCQTSPSQLVRTMQSAL